MSYQKGKYKIIKISSTLDKHLAFMMLYGSRHTT